MTNFPNPRTYVLAPPRTFADVEALANAEAAANGWAVKVEHVVVDGQNAILVTFSEKVMSPAATLAAAAQGAAAAPPGVAPVPANKGDGILPLLSALTEPTAISDLPQQAMAELQTALSRLGLPIGEIDGLFGPKTRNAWAEFKTDDFPGNPMLIGPDSTALLKDKLRRPVSTGSNAPALSGKASTIEAIKRECQAQEIGLPSQIAYVLATTQWETAQTFHPVKEAFWKDEDWRRVNLRYYPYYGRGYVQLTWKKNYEAYAKILGVDLVDAPDLALAPKTALFVLVHGFKTGAFTGRKITDYVNVSTTDFIAARRCINGTDHASDIANLAKQFLSSL